MVYKFWQIIKFIGQPVNAIKSPSRIVFKHFAYFLGKASLRNISFLLAGQEPVHNMHNSLSETLCLQYNQHWCSSRNNFRENICFESFEKTGKVINKGFTS